MRNEKKGVIRRCLWQRGSHLLIMGALSFKYDLVSIVQEDAPIMHQLISIKHNFTSIKHNFTSIVHEFVSFVHTPYQI